MNTPEYLDSSLARSADVTPEAHSWLTDARSEVAGGADSARFAALVALASRHFRNQRLRDAAQPDAVEDLPEGCTAERWTLLETARVLLVLARSDLAETAGFDAVEDAFRYADRGELCALYRSLAHMPEPARFTWRAGEGCRTNMVDVFEAVALDTSFPFAHFDEVAFNQAAIKSVFIGAPLWRLYGLDQRLGPELARIALDLCEERRSAGRPIPHDLWLCVGSHGGDRGTQAIERELETSTEREARCAAGIALARAGAEERLASWLEREEDPEVTRAWLAAQANEHGRSQWSFRDLDTSDS